MVPGCTDKDPKDTPNRVFNKLAWQPFYGTEGVPGSMIKLCIWMNSRAFSSGFPRTPVPGTGTLYLKYNYYCIFFVLDRGPHIHTMFLRFLAKWGKLPWLTLLNTTGRKWYMVQLSWRPSSFLRPISTTGTTPHPRLSAGNCAWKEEYRNGAKSIGSLVQVLVHWHSTPENSTKLVSRMVSPTMTNSCRARSRH